MAQQKQKLARDEKLAQRCEVLADVVSCLQDIYQRPTLTRTQKDLLETMIGAAIWYLPECDGMFTGKMSIKALEICQQDPKQWAKLTKEHCYPRKRAGADLLLSEKARLTGKNLLDDFQAKWGRYNRVTKQENRALVLHQRKGMSPDECYSRAGIGLVDVPCEFSKKLGRRRTVQNSN